MRENKNRILKDGDLWGFQDLNGPEKKLILYRMEKNFLFALIFTFFNKISFNEEPYGMNDNGRFLKMKIFGIYLSNIIKIIQQ